VEITEYEYDDQGRLARSMTVTESPFDTEQVDLLLALSEYEKQLDPNGFPIAEATSEDANPENYESRNPIRYIAHGPFTNWAEKSRLDAEEAYRAKFGKDNPPNMNGMYFTVEKKTYAPIGD